MLTVCYLDLHSVAHGTCTNPKPWRSPISLRCNRMVCFLMSKVTMWTTWTLTPLSSKLQIGVAPQRTHFSCPFDESRNVLSNALVKVSSERLEPDLWHVPDSVIPIDSVGRGGLWASLSQSTDRRMSGNSLPCHGYQNLLLF